MSVQAILDPILGLARAGVPYAQKLFPDMGELGVLFTVIAVSYVVLVHVGKAAFKKREPVQGLENILFLWNMGHSLFSLIWLGYGYVCVSEGYRRHGIDFIARHTWPEFEHDQVCRNWGWVYGLSKIVEFGDTAFLVLRKKPIPFLHWVHHFLTFGVVMIWHSETNGEDGLARVLAMANLLVHTLMYFYYAIGAKKFFRFPEWYQRGMTALQITQMFYLAIGTTYGWYYGVISLIVAVPYVSMVSLFAFLFVKFYLERYVWRTSHHNKKKGDKGKKKN
jgi:elongation of very long chain fatty acids protein 6